MDATQKAMEKLQNDENLKEEMKKEIKNIETTALASVQSMYKLLENDIDAEIKSSLEIQSCQHQIYEGKISDISCCLDGADLAIYKLAQGASVLKDELGHVRKTSHAGIITEEKECVQFSMQGLLEYKRESQSIFEDLKIPMVKLETEADGESVRFFQFGFKDRKDSEG
jgi:hypothetical protein